MIFIIVTGVLGVLVVLAVAFIVIPAIKRAEELTPEERAIVALFGEMRAEDTGGLLALPRYDTTVAIAAVDRRAAVRTIIHHEAPGRRVGTAATRDGDPVTLSGTVSAPATTVARPGWCALALRAQIAALGALIKAGRPASVWPHETGWYSLAAIDAAIAAGGA